MTHHMTQCHTDFDIPGMGPGSFSPLGPTEVPVAFLAGEDLVPPALEGPAVRLTSLHPSNLLQAANFQTLITMFQKLV